MAVGEYPLPEMRKRVWQPRTLAEAWQLKRTLGEQAVIVSGGTLLRTQWEAGTAIMPGHLISLESVPELQVCEAGGAAIRIGAGVTLAACQRWGDAPSLLKEACRRIAAPSIRRLGTIGGNVMSASGDSLPALAVTDAELVWYDGSGSVAEPVGAWLEQRRAVGGSAKETRLLKEVRWSRKADDQEACGYYEKVGRREGFCPSVVTVAGQFRLDAAGRLRGVRLAAGSAAAVACRLAEAEALLEGSVWSADLRRSVHQAVMEGFDGGADAFATAAYRKRAAAHLLTAFLEERVGCRGD